MCFCRVPTFCSSLQRVEACDAFGQAFFSSTFDAFREQLLDKVKADSEKSSLSAVRLPEFLNRLEKEVKDKSSGIWSNAFNEVPSIIPPTDLESKCTL